MLKDMSASGKDRCELMESLNITVIDGTDGDNLWLCRNGIYIPFNLTNFMLFDESRLVTDVLRRFRERQMDYPIDVDKMDEEWKERRHESNVQQMAQYMEDITPKQFQGNNIVLKKKIIRDKLIEKGLMRSDAE